MKDNSLVSIIKNKYKNNQLMEIMAKFISDNIDKAITWTANDALINFNLKHINVDILKPKENDWIIFLNDDEVNSFLQNETLKSKRVTIRKLIANLDENKKPTQQEVKALELLSSIINTQEKANDKVVYIQYKSNFRFDNQDKEFINLVETTNED